MDTVQITIPVGSGLIREEVIAQLSLLDFDSFEEKETELLAFISKEKFDADSLADLLSAYNLNYTAANLPNQNWNAIWESSFEPVVVDDFCAIRAEFHRPFSNIKHEIVITPKMSFGTGHHATTYLMISEMRKIDFTRKRVADFGTGTGVLAILASKLGSASTWAIDNDDWSIDNAIENVRRNNCQNIEIEKADGFNTSQTFDIVLANINKNIILQNGESLVAGLTQEGQLLLSGLLAKDETDVVETFVQKGLARISTATKEGWICILLQKR